MPAPQIRLDQAVASALRGDFGPAASLSAAANSALRDYYGLPGGTAPGAPPEPPAAPLAASARPDAPSRPAPQPAASGMGRCRHPRGWRIAGRCAACGAAV